MNTNGQSRKTNKELLTEIVQTNNECLNSRQKIKMEAKTQWIVSVTKETAQLYSDLIKRHHLLECI